MMPALEALRQIGPKKATRLVGCGFAVALVIRIAVAFIPPPLPIEIPDYGPAITEQSAPYRSVRRQTYQRHPTRPTDITDYYGSRNHPADIWPQRKIP